MTLPSHLTKAPLCSSLVPLLSPSSSDSHRSPRAQVTPTFSPDRSASPSPALPFHPLIRSGTSGPVIPVAP
ncbi:unnamed protein product [Boreogadus saida]